MPERTLWWCVFSRVMVCLRFSLGLFYVSRFIYHACFTPETAAVPGARGAFCLFLGTEEWGGGGGTGGGCLLSEQEEDTRRGRVVSVNLLEEAGRRRGCFSAIGGWWLCCPFRAKIICAVLSVFWGRGRRRWAGGEHGCLFIEKEGKGEGGEGGNSAACFSEDEGEEGLCVRNRVVAVSKWDLSSLRGEEETVSRL